MADILAQYLSLAPIPFISRGSIFVATCTRASRLVNLEVPVMALRAVACALSNMVSGNLAVYFIPVRHGCFYYVFVNFLFASYDAFMPQR